MKKITKIANSNAPEENKQVQNAAGKSAIGRSGYQSGHSSLEQSRHNGSAIAGAHQPAIGVARNGQHPNINLDKLRSNEAAAISADRSRRMNSASNNSANYNGIGATKSMASGKLNFRILFLFAGMMLLMSLGQFMAQYFSNPAGRYGPLTPLAAIFGHALLIKMLGISQFILLMSLLAWLYVYVYGRKKAKRKAKANINASQPSMADARNTRISHNIFQERTLHMYGFAKSNGKSVACLAIQTDRYDILATREQNQYTDILRDSLIDELKKRAPVRAEVGMINERIFGCSLICDPGSMVELEQLADNLSGYLSQIAEKINLGDQYWNGKSHGIDSHDIGGAQHLAGGTRDKRVIFAIGIADTSLATHDPQMLMRDSEAALLCALRNLDQRNQSDGTFNRHIVFFDPKMAKQQALRGRVENGIENALSAREIKPWYQAQYNLDNGKLCGFEVLARWQSPEHGLIGPETFISVAEDSDFINQISLQMMRRSLFDARHWDAALKLAFNISDRQMLDPWLAQNILRILYETGFPSERLELEISENSLSASPRLAHSTLIGLKNQGVGIVLDGFGSGYSSLAKLQILPIDKIKIGTIFTVNLADNPEDRALVNGIVQIGKAMNLRVSAVGIESKTAAEYLYNIGCVSGQGYYFGAPEPIIKVRKLLAEKNLLVDKAAASEENIEDQGESYLQSMQIRASNI